MKKPVLFKLALVASLGLAACAPADETADVADEPEALEAAEPAEEMAEDAAAVEAAEDTAGALDPDGNPVDQ